MSKLTLKKKINYAILGCGRISFKHVQAILLNNKHAHIVALCDSNIRKARKLKKSIGDVKIYTKLSALLKDADVDVVSICTPSGLHAKMALTAMKAGKDVIIEKPIAMSVRDATAIEIMEKKTGRLALPVMQNRFNKVVQLVKGQIKNCGKVLHVDASVYWYRSQQYYNDGIHGTRKMDGGVLMNQGIHYVDTVTYFMGNLPEKIYADGGTYCHKMECEDTIALTMKYADGRISCIRANTISYPKNFEGSITIFCEHATIKISGTALNRIDYWAGKGSEKINRRRSKSTQDIYGSGHVLVYKNFYEMQKNGRPRYIDQKEAIGSIKIVEAAYQSLSKGVPIKI